MIGRPPLSLLVKDLGGLGLYYPGQALISRMPRGLLEAAGNLGGDVVRMLSSEMEEALIELRLSFPDGEIPGGEGAVLKKAWRLSMYNEMEVLRYPHLNPDTIDDVCVVEGREHLDAALAAGKGAVVLIGHFGANQMIMPALGHKGYPMSQLSAPPPVWADILAETRTTPLWRRVLERRWELEKRLPVQHINVFKFLRPAVDCLKNNEVLGLAFDGGGGRRWTNVEMLGRRANLSTQPMQLVRMTGAALLPTMVTREPGERRHRVVIHKPLDYQTLSDRTAEMQVNMQSFADIFSEWVRKYPEQYLYFMLLRRRVRGSDVMPFFEDYPELDKQMSSEQAREHLRQAGSKT